MAKLTVLLVAIFFAISATGQTSSVTGTVADTSQQKGIQNAVVALLLPGDSILYKFTRTSADGSYAFRDVKPGTYIVMTTHPYYADILDNVTVSGPNFTLPAIPLTSKIKLLQEVIVKSGNPIRIKGDTTIYTADSFKVSANANVEELLKKLPGIQVDKNGQIKAMGETVEKVLVDGEEFFGDDPGMAVKNLRADAVKEVQVFDKKSDQAEFTGIDDGKTQKTINLKLKEDKKKGYFGKIDASGGLQKNIDHRYNNNLLFSSFKGKRKLSAFLLNGNTGQDGLNWQDSEKFGGNDENMSMSLEDDGMMMMSWKGGGSDDEPYVNTQNGFIKNVNAGVQYSNKWNEKQTLNLSPKYNSQDYNNRRQTFTQTQVDDSVFNEYSIVNTNVKRYNFKNTGTYDWKIDSNNNIKFTVKANFYHTETEENRAAESLGENGNFKNTSDRTTRTNTDKNSIYGSALFKHKFKKLRRTLSLNADWQVLNTEGTNFLKSINQDFSFPVPTTINVDQMVNNDKSNQKVSSKLIYTEPLSKKYALELAHEISLTTGTNNQSTYSYTPASGKYDQQVDSLTNEFDQSILVNKPSLKISFSDKKVKFNFGSGFGFTHFDLEDKTFDKAYIRNYTNFFPAASFTYTYKSNHSFRFNYNGYTNQPTINQLQPLRNNNDQFNQYIGNPDLKPSFANSFNISHNGYDFLKDRWMYQSLNINLTSNSITNNRVIDLNSGKTIIQPINTNGNVNVNFWSGLGFKLKKLDTRLDLSPHFSYSKLAEVINSNPSFSKTLNAGLSVNLSKSKDKKYDVSMRNDVTLNRNKNSQSDNINRYVINTLSLDATIYIKKVWSISSDFEYAYRQALTEFDNDLNTQLWNAKLQKTFKSDEFTAYLKVRDILNQNLGVDRNFYGNTYTETRNDRLKRYWMLGFTWNFKNKGAAAK